jgi:hypothetical protein
MIIKILILIGLAKLLDVSESPWLCATIYTIVSFIMRTMVVNPNWTTIIFWTFVSLLTSFIYFYLLNRTKGGIAYWIILILGFAIGLV